MARLGRVLVDGGFEEKVRILKRQNDEVSETLAPSGAKY